ncbi:MAG TPA: hypothetical protein PLT68_02890 [Actinomycetota bacterium]|nr:hypothetical protein [Actinomycetota bacterium]
MSWFIGMPYGPVVGVAVGLTVGLALGLAVALALLEGLLVAVAEAEGVAEGPSAAIAGDTVVTMARALSTATGVRIPLSYQTISG